MNDKLQESAQYLKCCSDLETEAFKLYETFSKKINQPESCFVLGFAYDSLKCSKIIQGLLDYVEAPESEKPNVKKNFAELTNGVADLNKKIAKINNVDYELSCEILKELSNLEDQLTEAYSNYIQSPAIKTLVEEFSKLTVNLTNFKKIFESFMEQKQKHKENILDILSFFENRETERLRRATPVVKYQNPNAWVLGSTLHNFSNTPVQEST
jgi:hypothetical protein